MAMLHGVVLKYLTIANTDLDHKGLKGVKSDTVYGKTFKGENFRGCTWTKHTNHWKTFAVHQAHIIMYCTQQMIQGENVRDWLKTVKTAKVFPLESFAVYGIMLPNALKTDQYSLIEQSLIKFKDMIINLLNIFLQKILSLLAPLA